MTKKPKIGANRGKYFMGAAAKLATTISLQASIDKDIEAQDYSRRDEIGQINDDDKVVDRVLTSSIPVCGKILQLDASFIAELDFLGLPQEFSMRTIRKIPTDFRLITLLFSLSVIPAVAQRSVDESASHGNQAEIVVTLRDPSGQLMTGPAFVSISRSGSPGAEAAANRGIAMFLTAPGDYTVQVNASGYKNAQADVSAPMPMTVGVEIVLQKKDDDSADASTTASLLAPKAREALEKGLKALAENNLREADEYIGEAMKLAPQDSQVLYAQGLLDIQKQDWAKAQSVLEKATQMDPNSAPALAALGMALVNQRKYDAAIPPLEKSLKLDPKGNFEVRWALGKAYYYHGQYDDALKVSQIALTESGGKAPDIEMLVAQSLVAVGRYEDSAQALREFIKNHGNDPQATTARRWLQKLAADGKIRNN